MVPAGPSALGLVAALDPEGFLDDLSADALLLLLVIINLPTFYVLLSLRLLLRCTLAFFLLPLILPLALLRLVNIFFFEVIEHHTFEIEGVEKGALSQGLDVVGIDCTDLEGVLPLLNHLAVLGDFSDFGVATVDGLQKIVLIVHGLDGALDVLEIVLVVGVCLDELDHLLALLQRHCQSEFQQGQMLQVRRPAHDLIISTKVHNLNFIHIPVSCIQFLHSPSPPPLGYVDIDKPMLQRRPC